MQDLCLQTKSEDEGKNIVDALVSVRVTGFRSLNIRLPFLRKIILDKLARANLNLQDAVIRMLPVYRTSREAYRKRASELSFCTLKSK